MKWGRCIHFDGAPASRAKDFEGKSMKVCGVMFASHDGKTRATVGLDGVVQWWKVDENGIMDRKENEDGS
jgi:hypothetical protein